MFSHKRIIIFLYLFVAVNNVLSLSTTLTVGELGTVIGRKETTCWSTRTIYAFRGIPYVEAPIEDLRFRIEDGHSNTILPVMIWIHGGSFIEGYTSIYEPHYLLEGNVILVVIQFRLGPLGFPCLQTDEVPGNVQFLDRVMAMQWVQDNIGYFGSVRNRVTLFGQSSGGISVNLHQFSPLSRGLFHQAIIQSGLIFGSWVIDSNPLRTASNLGAIVGCNQSNTTLLAVCFKTLDVQILLDGFDTYLELYTIQGIDTIGGNRAVVQAAGTQRFLEEDPRTLIARGEFTQVPMIGGATKHNGSYLVLEYYNSLFVPLGIINDTEFLQYKFTSLVVNTFGIDDFTGGVAQTLIKTHYNDEDIGDFEKMIPGLTDITTVFAFKSGIFEIMQRNSRLQPSYLYTFNYFDSALRSGSNSYLPFEIGVGHSGELSYLFPITREMPEEDLAVAKRIVSLWTSFAINGVPIFDGSAIWESISKPFGPYLIIEEEFRQGTNYLDEFTIARKEGMTHVQRSSAIYETAP